jgi:hypothetical protein
MQVIQAIESLYNVFSQYPRPKDFNACVCCVNDLEKVIMLNTPLQDLTAANLKSYATSLFHTVGGMEDFRYFLPRIMEIYTTSDFSYPDIEIVLKKLALANWLNWPQQDQAAVIAVIDAKFDELLYDSKLDINILDSWICAIGQCVDNITPYLDKLLTPGREKVLQAYVSGNLSAFTKNKLANPFWDKGSQNEQLTLEWLKNEDQVIVFLHVEYGMII